MLRLGVKGATGVQRGGKTGKAGAEIYKGLYTCFLLADALTDLG
jgi:hypothetical protein